MSIKNRTLERGSPDWANIRKPGLSVSLSDMGELAARLGSIVTYDRRGEVIMLETFESEINSRWTKAGLAGASTGVSVDTARNGAASYHAQTGVGADVGGSIARSLGYSHAGKAGLELSFAIPVADVYLDLLLALYNGTNQYRANIRYNAATGIISYMNSTGVFTQLASGFNIYAALSNFTTFKLVADFETLEYLYLLANTVSYDMSGLALRTVASAVAPTINVQLGVFNVVGPTRSVYFDDIIITQNER